MFPQSVIGENDSEELFLPRGMVCLFYVSYCKKYYGQRNQQPCVFQLQINGMDQHIVIAKYENPSTSTAV